MLSLLSRKAFSPHSLRENRDLTFLHSEPLFIIGLVFKLICIVLFLPVTHSQWFLPFLNNAVVSFSIDPWSDFLQHGNSEVAFPYGIAMLTGYFPLSFLGVNIDKLFNIEFLFPLLFTITSLLYDYLILIALSLLTRVTSNKLLLFLYWCSPLFLYITYFHGQLDVLPVMLLVWSICFIQWNRFKLSALFISLAISCKFSMLIALPLILIYIHRRRGFSFELLQFLAVILFSLSFLIVPFLFSSGFVEMVLNTPEALRLYTVSISYGPRLNVYIVPVIYLLALYLVWRLDRITQDLFILSTGIGFFSLLIFLPPAPGWFIWIIPFLVYYQVKSRKDIFGIAFAFSLITLFYVSLYSTGAEFLGPSVSVPEMNTFFLQLGKSNHFRSLLFTALQSSALLLAIRMYSYGLKSNAFYQISRKPLIIELTGNASTLVKELLGSFQKLFGSNKVNILDTFQDNQSIDTKKSNSPFATNHRLLVSQSIDTSRLLNSISQFSVTLPFNIDKFKSTNNFFSSAIVLAYRYGILWRTKVDYLFLRTLDPIPHRRIRELISFTLHLTQVSSDSEFINISPPNSPQDLSFWLTPINQSTISQPKFRLITFLPNGFIHDQLFRLLVAICAMHIDTEITPDKQWVKIIFEGEAQPADISQVSRLLVPQIDDFALFDSYWLPGYSGIIQLISLACISEYLHNSNNLLSPNKS